MTPAEVDALASEIADAVTGWAKGDPEALTRAAKILSVSPLLGQLPHGYASCATAWHCMVCGECPVYRGATAWKCRCGHRITDHAHFRRVYLRRSHASQAQPA